MADHINLQHLDQPNKHARREPVMDTTASAGRTDADDPDGIFRAELPADLTSARQARSAVRTALAAWGMDDPDGDTELLASELVANAAEHAGASPISLALRRHREPSGQPAITCEVTDTSPALPRVSPGPASRRARPRPGDRHRPRDRQRRASRASRQDHLVHPRPQRPHRTIHPASRARSRSRRLTSRPEGAPT